MDTRVIVIWIFFEFRSVRCGFGENVSLKTLQSIQNKPKNQFLSRNSKKIVHSSPLIEYSVIPDRVKSFTQMLLGMYSVFAWKILCFNFFVSGSEMIFNEWSSIAYRGFSTQKNHTKIMKKRHLSVMKFIAISIVKIVNMIRIPFNLSVNFENCVHTFWCRKNVRNIVAVHLLLLLSLHENSIENSYRENAFSRMSVQLQCLQQWICKAHGWCYWKCNSSNIWFNKTDRKKSRITHFKLKK